MCAALTELSDQPTLPRAIGPYRILDILGEGGMGIVYRAVSPVPERGRGALLNGEANGEADGKLVAVKTVRVPEGSSLAGIRSEILALSRIHHPYIVQILGEGVVDGIPWYAMELLDGTTVRDYHDALWSGADGSAQIPGMASAGVGSAATSRMPATEMPAWEGPTRRVPMGNFGSGAIASTLAMAGTSVRGANGAHDPIERRPVAAGRLREVLTLMRRLCAPLAYLHGRGVVHRDLKPGNVFVRPNGEPVLMDFGLAARFRGGVGRETLELSGMLVGTATYMAPEQAMGLLVDARADLYAFGVMLYEMLTGEVPFSARTTHELLQQHCSSPPEPPSSLVDGVSERLDALVLRLLAKRSRERFGYAEDVAAELTELGAEPSPEVRSRTYLYRPELAGRDETLATLQRSIEQLRDGSGGRLLIGGESGVGKTSLVSRAARNAMLAHLVVVTGECLPIAASHGAVQGAAADSEPPFSKAADSASRRGQAAKTRSPVSDVTTLDIKGAPLHPFLPLLRRIADYCREGGRARTDALLDRRGKVLAAYEPSFLDLPGQREQPDPVDLPAEAAHLRLLDALAETLASFVGHVGHVLLILDDLQWADELSLSFLASLPADYFERRPLLLFMTYRSEEVGVNLRKLIDRFTVGHLQLGRLDERTVGAIVSDMLALPDPPAPFVRFLAQQSEGNPFFIAEYLRAAVDEGLIHREQGAWRFAPDAGAPGSGGAAAAEAALPLPLSLRELVMRRLMGLQDETRALIEVASVFGREVETPLLLRIVGAEEGAMLDALKELALRQVLLPADDERHRFAHDKLREITYGGIPVERRRALHRAAAEAIERALSSSTHLARHYSELAHHWVEAEVWSKAVHYLEKAGEQALRDCSNREAIRFFRQAIALGGRMQEPPGPLQLARWERSLVEAHQGLGEDAKGRVHAELALRHCRRPIPSSRAGRLLGFLAQIAIRVMQSWVPLRKVTSPVRRALLLEAAYVSQRMIEPAFRDNDPLLGTYCGLRSLNLAERVPVSAPLARSYAFLSLVVGMTPLSGVARSWSEKALRYAAELGSDPLMIYCLSRVGSYSNEVADWDSTYAQLGRAVELARGLGDRRQLEEALSLFGVGLHANGRFAETVTAGREALSSGQERGDMQAQGWSRNYTAQSLTRLGRSAEALALLASGRAWVEGELAEDTEVLWAAAAEALALYAAGEPEAARSAADSALGRLRKRPPVQHYLGASCAELVEVYLALWEDAAGAAREAGIAASALEAVKILERLSRIVHFVRPAALRARAVVAWLQGAERRAFKLWRRSLVEAERLRMPYEEARAHLDLGLHLEAHAEARKHLDAAIALLTPLAASADLLRARAALEELDR